MKNFLVIIGSIILAAILIAAPILCGLSFALKWSSTVRFLLTITTTGDFLCLASKFIDENTEF